MNPLCYKCIYRREAPGSHHSQCQNWSARVKGNQHGIKNGWFFWPIDFDPIWLESCTGFKEKEKKDEST